MYAQPSDIATILGLPATTTLLDLAARCEDGLPVECLLELADTMEPDKRGFAGFLITPSALCRRRKRGTLSPHESELVVRMASTWIMASQTFRDDAKARRFLFGEHSLLGGDKPVDLARMNAAGAQAVEQVLGRLKYGSAA